MGYTCFDCGYQSGETEHIKYNNTFTHDLEVLGSPYEHYLGHLLTNSKLEVKTEHHWWQSSLHFAIEIARKEKDGYEEFKAHNQKGWQADLLEYGNTGLSTTEADWWCTIFANKKIKHISSDKVSGILLVRTDQLKQRLQSRFNDNMYEGLRWLGDNKITLNYLMPIEELKELCIQY